MKLIQKLGMLALASATFMACESDDNGGASTDDDGGNANLEFDNSLFVSNNSNGDVTIYDIEDLGTVSTTSFGTASTDAEGIYYDASIDEILQVSRSEGTLDAYADVSLGTTGIDITVAVSSAASLDSPRDIAVSGTTYVVADNADVDGDETTADGRFFVFTKAADGSLTLRNTATVDFAVWGIEFDGSTLIAVVDKTSDVALFENFVLENTTDATVVATKRITLEGIVRTHGLAIDGGTLILTDVGDAMDDADGGFHIIEDYQSKFDAIPDGETLVVLNNQIRVAGAGTFLGNPVAAEYDASSNVVFIAERANGGGRVLAFTDAAAGGAITPAINNQLSGASSLYLNQ